MTNKIKEIKQDYVSRATYKDLDATQADAIYNAFQATTHNSEGKKLTLQERRKSVADEFGVKYGTVGTVARYQGRDSSQLDRSVSQLSETDIEKARQRYKHSDDSVDTILGDLNLTAKAFYSGVLEGFDYRRSDDKPRLARMAKARQKANGYTTSPADIAEVVDAPEDQPAFRYLAEPQESSAKPGNQTKSIESKSIVDFSYDNPDQSVVDTRLIGHFLVSKAASAERHGDHGPESGPVTQAKPLEAVVGEANPVYAGGRVPDDSSRSKYVSDVRTPEVTMHAPDGPRAEGRGPSDDSHARGDASGHDDRVILGEDHSSRPVEEPRYSGSGSGDGSGGDSSLPPESTERPARIWYQTWKGKLVSGLTAAAMLAVSFGGGWFARGMYNPSQAAAGSLDPAPIAAEAPEVPTHPLGGVIPGFPDPNSIEDHVKSQYNGEGGFDLRKHLWETLVPGSEDSGRKPYTGSSEQNEAFLMFLRTLNPDMVKAAVASYDAPEEPAAPVVQPAPIPAENPTVAPVAQSAPAAPLAGFPDPNSIVDWLTSNYNDADQGLRAYLWEAFAPEPIQRSLGDEYQGRSLTPEQRQLQNNWLLGFLKMRNDQRPQDITEAIADYSLGIESGAPLEAYEGSGSEEQPTLAPLEEITVGGPAEVIVPPAVLTAIQIQNIGDMFEIPFRGTSIYNLSQIDSSDNRLPSNPTPVSALVGNYDSNADGNIDSVAELSTFILGLTTRGGLDSPVPGESDESFVRLVANAGFGPDVASQLRSALNTEEVSNEELNRASEVALRLGAAIQTETPLYDNGTDLVIAEPEIAIKYFNGF
ncbi:MAG: hypothetical protein ABII01_07110 [Candidatus Woesearchaeota archaeon]